MEVEDIHVVCVQRCERLADFALQNGRGVGPWDDWIDFCSEFEAEGFVVDCGEERFGLTGNVLGER